MFLGCGVVAFAIGCGGEAAPPAASAPKMDPAMMEKMANPATVKPAEGAEGAAEAAGEKKEEPAAEKKEEEKKEDPAAEKKEEKKE